MWGYYLRIMAWGRTNIYSEYFGQVRADLNLQFFMGGLLSLLAVLDYSPAFGAFWSGNMPSFPELHISTFPGGNEVTEGTLSVPILSSQLFLAWEMSTVPFPQGLLPTFCRLKVLGQSDSWILGYALGETPARPGEPWLGAEIPTRV